MASSSETTNPLPKLAITAASIAFLIAVLGLLSALRQPEVAILTIIPAAAGILIFRRRAWGAYGYALCLISQAVPAAVAAFRGTVPKQSLIVALAFPLLLSPLFFFAGQSLTKSGAVLGVRWPWIGVACLTSLPFLFVTAFVMPTGSMEETILIGDKLLVRAFPRPAPANGMIIIFRNAAFKDDIYVKRALGMPGDHIRIDAQTLYRNSSLVNEPYVVHNNPRQDKFPDLSLDVRTASEEAAKRLLDMLRNHVKNGEVIVPAGKIFVLGDNRDNSLDSRQFGFIDFNDVIGTPLFIYASIAPGEESSDPAEKGLKLRKIRWNRILKIVR